MSDNLWVFGYGSLMWNPGFAHRQAVKAKLHGAHRRLCIYSTHYRGTQEKPGLVYGLDRGGSCIGLAFEVEAAEREQVVDYLRKREQISDVYLEVVRPIRLAEGGIVNAMTYVANERHPQYAPQIGHEITIGILRQSRGIAGPNYDYVLATALQLRRLGIVDRKTEALARELERVAAP
jgi:glutathione-specific gamma-glutamylcyclotransferase